MAKLAKEQEAADRAAWEAGESAEVDEDGNPIMDMEEVEVGKDDLMAMSVEELTAMLEEAGGEEVGYVMVSQGLTTMPCRTAPHRTAPRRAAPHHTPSNHIIPHP